MSQGNRKRRGRGRQGRAKGAAEYQARADSDTEDSATFWARSNARLGFAGQQSQGGRRPRGAVESLCAVCGVAVLVDRAPKNRHDVRCEACRSALGSLLTGEERQIADQMRRARPRRNGRVRHDGIPAFTEEDLAALNEMKAKKELGNGRVGNRRRQPQGRRRNKGRGGGGGGGGGGDRQHNQGGGEGGGRRRRRRRRGRGEGGGGDGGNNAEQAAQAAPAPAAPPAEAAGGE